MTLLLQEEQKKHFENWETFWGRSGHGAPQAGKGSHKENLMRILHYPTQKVTIMLYYFQVQTSKIAQMVEGCMQFFWLYWLNYWHILISKVQAVLRLILY